MAADPPAGSAGNTGSTGTAASAQAPGTAGIDDWARWVVGWHLAFWAVVAIGLLRLALAVDLSPATRLGGAGVLVVLGGSYALTVQAPGWPRGRGALPYLSVAVLAAGVACALDPSLSMLLFILYPQTWMLTSTLRSGAVGTVAVTLSATAGFVLRLGASTEVIRSLGPQMLVSLLFSVLLGFWITRIIEQSRERAALLAQVEATRAELAQAHHAQGVMAERERLAREIHDTLAQGFTSIVMHTQAASGALRREGRAHPDVLARLTLIEDVARENLAEARALVAAFTPVGLDGTTLPDAIRRLATRFGVQTGLSVEVEVTSTAGLGRAREVVVLRAVQEALANVRRHAHARHVSVRLVADAGAARVEVHDDGVGFAPQAPTDGFGLAGIRGRLADVGGELDVTSAPGAGTRLVLHVPLVEGSPA